ncbi:MAG: hypothetical protein QOE33_1900 [Acidobacteriota bacterium]|nr:hypothetical protein [Acidobacteriota bacterium]
MAAQSALSQGQLKLALDLVMRLVAADEFHVTWRDQFLGQLVERALSIKDEETAQAAMEKIKGTRARAAALRRIGAYFFLAKDVVRSREIFGEIVKLLKGAQDGADNAAEYLTLVASFSKIDEQRIPEVLQLAIKSLNNIPTPKAGEEAGGATRREYAETLMIIAPQIVSAFRSLARRARHSRSRPAASA